MWNSHPPLSLLETMGEGRLAPYAAVWVCVVRARVCSRTEGLSPCMRVCPSGQLGVCTWGVCVGDCVWAVHVCVGLCMSLFVCLCHAAKSSFASNDKQSFPGPRLREDWSKSSSDTALLYNIVQQGPPWGLPVTS